jgi:hypothetical protein
MPNGMRAYPLGRQCRELGTYPQRIPLDQGVDPESGDRMPQSVAGRRQSGTRKRVCEPRGFRC